MSLLANPYYLAVAASLPSTVYLHKKEASLRGDVGLFILIAVAASFFGYERIALGATIWAAILSAFSFVISYATSMILATVAYRLSPFHPLAAFPGPILNKITSLTLAHMVWTGKRYLVIGEMHKKYGKVVRTGPSTLSIHSYPAISTLYSSASAWSKSEAYIPGKMSGNGLFFILSKEEHNVRRRLWAPAFTPKIMANYKPVVETRTHELMDCMAERRQGKYGTINLSDAIQHWSYDVMGQLTFGGSSRLELMKDNDLGNYVESGQMATVAFESLGEVPWLFDILYYLPLTKVIRSLEDLANNLLIARQKNPTGTFKDIASVLLGEHDTKPEKLSQDDLRIDSLFAIQAGSDTTSGVLTFVFYHLINSKDSYDRLRAELDQTFPDKDGSLDFEVLANLSFLNCVVEESLRLGTPFGGQPRITPKGGASVDGIFIPDGTIVAVPSHAQNVSPDNFWPEPLTFKPERWLPGGLGPGSRLNKGAVSAFGFGAFGCLGKALALQELRLVTARMLLTYDLDFSPEFDKDAFIKGIKNMRTTVFEYPLLVTAKRRG